MMRSRTSGSAYDTWFTSTPVTAAPSLAIRALRAPAPFVPGWFPLVVEPVHRRLRSSPRGEVVADVAGLRMALDTAEYTQRRFLYGCWEHGELRFLRRVVRSGDVVLDVGAHVGFMALAAARAAGPNGEVHAFEPVPANADRLARNVELNALTTVRMNAVAVGASAGAVRLGLTEIGVSSGTTGGYTVGGEHGQVETEMISLDEYVAESVAARRVRLLKIDAEGHEPEVLAGFSRTLAEMPPDAIMLEVNSRMLGGDDAELLNRLTVAGYRLHRIGRRGSLRPMPEAREIAAAEERRRAAGDQIGRIRAGLMERDAFFNAAAIRPGSGIT